MTNSNNNNVNQWKLNIPETVTVSYYNPETETKLTVEERKINEIVDASYQFQYEDGITHKRGYGPSDNWYDSSTGNWVRTTIKIREFRLKISITGGTWWYYTNDKAGGIGGESSWWDTCDFWTKIIQFGSSSQWRTNQMLIKSYEDARSTIRAFADGRIIVVNAVGCDSETSRATKRNTVNALQRAIERWEDQRGVDMDETA